MPCFSLRIYSIFQTCSSPPHMVSFPNLLVGLGSRGGLYQWLNPAVMLFKTQVPSAFTSLPCFLHTLQILWDMAYLLPSALADSITTPTLASTSRAIGEDSPLKLSQQQITLGHTLSIVAELVKTSRRKPLEADPSASQLSDSSASTGPEGPNPLVKRQKWCKQHLLCDMEDWENLEDKLFKLKSSAKTD